MNYRQHIQTLKFICQKENIEIPHYENNTSYFEYKNILESILAKKLLTMTKKDAENIAWEYFYNAPVCWSGHSSILNKRTIIHVCGINESYPEGTILHYTQSYTFYGKSTDKDEFGRELGEEPIFYYGEFYIDDNFQLSFEELKNEKIKFIPKINYPLNILNTILNNIK
jgi:hypothetical protein